MSAEATNASLGIARGDIVRLVDGSANMLVIRAVPGSPITQVCELCTVQSFRVVYRKSSTLELVAPSATPGPQGRKGDCPPGPSTPKDGAGTAGRRPGN